MLEMFRVFKKAIVSNRKHQCQRNQKNTIPHIPERERTVVFRTGFYYYCCNNIVFYYCASKK